MGHYVGFWIYLGLVQKAQILLWGVGMRRKLNKVRSLIYDDAFTYNGRLHHKKTTKKETKRLTKNKGQSNARLEQS